MVEDFAIEKEVAQSVPMSINGISTGRQMESRPGRWWNLPNSDL
jgi:hypothetical protein